MNSPVTLVEAKPHPRADQSDDDSPIQVLVAAVTRPTPSHAEQQLRQGR
jgi:hypothetical protein